MSHDIVTEQITLMGNTLLRSLLQNIIQNSPAWHAIMGDEASDIANREQLNISIRWVNESYEISEDPVGLFCLTNTTADAICDAIKDILIRSSLPLSLCRGQAYDGASNMQGCRKGVATQIKRESPSALSVHCFAHKLNPCLQDVGKQLVFLRDALEVVREIAKLIKFSPKRASLFSQVLAQPDNTGVTIKPLCLTRCTARHIAIEAVLKDYKILLETLEEINQTTHDEYGMKAGGILETLLKFQTLFGLQLAYILFGASESLSRSLQAKDLSLQEALSAVNLAKSFYERQRNDQAFKSYYDKAVRTAQELQIEEPKLPRYRRAPRRLDQGSRPHQFATPMEYFRQQYNEACALLIGELNDRFEQRNLLPPVLALESVLLNAANGLNYQDQLTVVQQSCYKDDFNFSRLESQLGMLADAIKVALPSVRKVTSIRTICDAMNAQTVYKSMLSEVHKQLRLYLTVPITTATSE